MSSPHPPSSQPDRLVIGFTGHIGAGKTSAARYLQETHGFQYVRYSQVLAEWLVTDANTKGRLQEVGWEVMSRGMQTELNSRLIARIEEGKDYAVDGLRHPIDYDTLRAWFGNSLFLVFLQSTMDTRWNRLQHQSKYSTFEAFAKADSHPVEQNIEALRPRAQFIIQNDGSMKDLHSRLNGIVQELRTGGRP